MECSNAAHWKVAVLFGGRSSEHTVSLQSAHAVLCAMAHTRFEAVPVGITREGRWLWYRGALEAIPSGAWEEGDCLPVTLSPDPAVHGLLLGGGDGLCVPPPVGRGYTREYSCGSDMPGTTLYLDAAFPVLHGKNGEDGTVQGLLALGGIPCVGCGVLGSAVCMDKDTAHRLAREAGVEVPAGLVIERGDDALAAARRIGFPLFVKPVRAGSSYGVTRVETEAGLADAAALAFTHDSRVLLEQAVAGFEVGCAVLGTGASLTTGEVDEIELPPACGLFDYTEKYTLKTARIHMPARLPDAERARIRTAAKTVYRALGCEGFARVDLFYTPEGRIIFNEVNTIPGFTAHSRFPAMMRGAGLDFDALVARLIEGTVGAL